MARHGTAQHGAAQQSTAQHSTAQHSTISDNRMDMYIIQCQELLIISWREMLWYAYYRIALYGFAQCSKR